MQKENDTLLVAKLREGNKFAFEALYEKYSARLYNTIVLLVYDKSLAKSFPAYLCTIARNMVYKETERRLLHNKFVENKLKTEAEAIEEDTMDMDVSIIEKQIEQLLQSLPEVSREVFQLKRAGKLSNKEIASQLDLTERAVEAHFYRTMKLLKEELRKFIMLFLSFYFLNNC